MLQRGKVHERKRIGSEGVLNDKTQKMLYHITRVHLIIRVGAEKIGNAGILFGPS